MRKGDFWFLTAAWYLLLMGVLAVGVSRFGGDYIIRWFVNPSVKTVLFIVLAVLPLPFMLERSNRTKGKRENQL